MSSPFHTPMPRHALGAAAALACAVNAGMDTTGGAVGHALPGVAFGWARFLKRATVGLGSPVS